LAHPTVGAPGGVLMGNSYPLTPEADAAIHRTLDDAFCGATD